MYRGRVGIKQKGHWQYKEFAVSNIHDVYTIAEMYRQKIGSMSVSIKFEEADKSDSTNEAK